MKTCPVYIVLLHSWVVNRRGEQVTTAITNMDIHDISRSARTYGVEEFFLVTPVKDQHDLVRRILKHWSTDEAKAYHPDRVEALARVRLAESFEEVKKLIRDRHGQDPEVTLTDACKIPNAISYEEYRKELSRNSPVLLVFGTGWGVSKEFHSRVNRILLPLYGPEGQQGYNHLSVRAAVAVVLDRLLGDRNSIEKQQVVR